MITDTKDGLSDSVYDQVIVPDMFSNTVILFLTKEEGKPVTGG